LYVVDKTQQEGICMWMLQSLRAWMVITEKLAAIFKRRRRHGFALFHPGDDGSRWTSVSEF